MPPQRRSCELTGLQHKKRCQRAGWGKGLLQHSLVSGLSTRSLDCASLSTKSCGFSIAQRLAEESVAVENYARLYVSGVTEHGEVCGGEPVEFHLKGVCMSLFMTKLPQFFAAFFAGPVAGPKPETHRRSRIGIRRQTPPPTFALADFAHLLAADPVFWSAARCNLPEDRHG